MFMRATPAEERLDQLLQAPDFAPPAEFAAQAKVADAAVYEQAAADPQAWWADQARQRLDWDTPFAEVLDDSNPPFYRWFADGSGVLVLTQPWPSMLRTLYADPDRFVSTYFDRFGPGVYFVGDGARRDEDGYFWITGRIDDVINVSGHRLSTAEIESALVAHPAVAEAAVIAVSDELTGQSVVAYVTLCAGVSAEPVLKDALRQHVAERIGKLARPKRIIWAEDVPKTRSGKIMRRLLRDIAEGRTPGDATTLRDASVLAKLQQATGQDDKGFTGTPETGNTR
jgi:acyl-CoA synthetase (AMP-forming)/AMP-acid ligase II